MTIEEAEFIAHRYVTTRIAVLAEAYLEALREIERMREEQSHKEGHHD